MLPSVRTPSFFHVFPYLLVIFSGNAFSNDQNFIVTDSIVISVPEFSSGITTRLNTKNPIQPLPTNDGASFLKVIPGFTVSRKGGANGDAMYRGLAGSRLNFILDGMEFLGGCNFRLDSPTAYVYPETYDQARLIKGPQTVKYGNGNSSGVVLFERNADWSSGKNGYLSGTIGSWGRADLLTTAEYVTSKFAVEANFSHSQADDYKDGAGAEVHSQYERDSATAIFGLKLSEELEVKFDFVGSEAEAAYSDRNVDGSLFDRGSYGFKVESEVEEAMLSLRAYTTYIDHVMDNFSLRTTANCGSDTDNRCLLMNVDRRTTGLRSDVEIELSDRVSLTVGADIKRDSHTSRNFMNKSLSEATSFESAARIRDFESEIFGIYLETEVSLSSTLDVMVGLRSDYWQADRFQNVGNTNTQSLFLGDDDQQLTSSFVRLEASDPTNALNGYIGFGSSRRPMDYWEATIFGGISANDVIAVSPEKTDQWDIGFDFSSHRISSSISVFVADVTDYILTTDNGNNDFVSNVDVNRWGGEADIRLRFAGSWEGFASLSYVRADNDTSNKPLAQTPPMEVKAGLDHSVDKWQYGFVLRYVDEQDRLDAGSGTVVGFDRSQATPSFTTVSLNLSYDISNDGYISFGIDNLLDEDYFEHISRSYTSTIFGFVTDVNSGVKEPGRALWMKAGVEF